MPELPEVEVTRLSLVERSRGARIRGVRLGKPLRWPLGCEPQALVGRAITDVSRRGKYLWFSLSPAAGGAAQAHDGLLMHLGMSGSLAWRPLPAPPPGPWDHFELDTDRGLLRLSDPRRFGAVLWSPSMHEGAAGKLLATLGIEPFDAGFDGRFLHAQLQRRSAPIKTVLLAGDVVVGVGNIYASEALFAAAIDPRAPARRLSLARCERLAGAIRSVLARALALGGSTLRDFRDAHGMDGAFQLEAKVYGRAGEACRRCPGTVKRLLQGQRATYFCSRCQHR
ncbi:bifunctional DNA-formamidopyrimidine glycosylase/DNA-(apurinic or apyrimidinic site) lyase [Rivibacter subsaxonicus]|nr:bifunctional DNA-formamidopyrimidine glycosylase/DNA-(apurinic or apyrimidinic site) lyase [Rivibacter subsaxonicus]